MEVWGFCITQNSSEKIDAMFHRADLSCTFLLLNQKSDEALKDKRMNVMPFQSPNSQFPKQNENKEKFSIIRPYMSSMQGFFLII